MDAQLFDRETLLQALMELGRRAYQLGKVVEIAIDGGSALMLSYDWRVATRDVDAVYERDRATIRRIAAEMAADHGWTVDWLNDSVKGWLSAADGDPDVKVLLGTYPSEREPGLRVFIPRPEYIFAMKCRAMRLGGIDATQDIEDIKRLIPVVGVNSAREAIDLVLTFYPSGLIEPKTQFGLEEIFADLEPPT